MHWIFRRFYIGLAVVWASADASAQGPLVRDSDIRSGWGTAEIHQANVLTADTFTPNLPNDTQPSTVQVHLTPGWAFAIGENSQGHTRIWRAARKPNTKSMQWVDWGGLPPGSKGSSFVFAHGAAWLVGDRSGRPQLFQTDAQSSSARWADAGSLPGEHIRDIRLTNDGRLEAAAETETGETLYYHGEFLGGGRDVAWSTEPTSDPIQFGMDTGDPRSAKFSGEVDIGQTAQILTLSWRASDTELSDPLIRYRIAPDEGEAYSPWSSQITQSPLRIGQRGRYIEYQIQFPQESTGTVNDVRVHYVLPEEGGAAPVTSSGGGGGAGSLNDPTGPEDGDTQKTQSQESREKETESTEDNRASEENKNSFTEPRSQDEQAVPEERPSPQSGQQTENSTPSPAASTEGGESAETTNPDSTLPQPNPNTTGEAQAVQGSSLPDSEANPTDTPAPSTSPGTPPSPSGTGQTANPNNGSLASGGPDMGNGPEPASPSSAGGTPSAPASGLGNMPDTNGSPDSPLQDPPAPQTPENDGEQQTPNGDQPESPPNPPDGSDNIDSGNPRTLNSPPAGSGSILGAIAGGGGGYGAGSPVGNEPESEKQPSAGEAESRQTWLKWVPLGAGLGIGWLWLFLLFLLFLRSRKREREQEEAAANAQDTINANQLSRLPNGYHPGGPEEVSLAPTRKKATPTPHAGMSAAAFQGKNAMYMIDESGRIHCAEIKQGRFSTARHVGSAPLHCENLKLAVAQNRLFFLASGSETQPPKLLSAEIEPKRKIGKWTPVTLPEPNLSFEHLWIEGDRLFLVSEDGDQPILFSTAIAEESGIRQWNRVADLPAGAHVESTATTGERCYIASRAAGSEVVDLISVALDKSKIVSRMGQVNEIKGQSSLVCESGRMILLDGGDMPGRAQIHVAQLAPDGELSSWTTRQADFHAVLNSASGIVVNERVLFAGRNGSNRGRQISISSYSTELPVAS